ncbi:CHAD domain-containing protein [Marinobacter salinexigens]|uniref:CHAD domain-containing protein n=1 Tax=Marinobacter salinexigens TaxID=2919747 RepID=A0A5B0VIJ0_9GAMM|nr:CHAD domain-containing protein [Marinobacter salinexigens]KAA1174416.1 CHAD domain-containing protein [Marinobacter salinexigens]
MKHLFLIRHAKSSWTDEQLSDKERPLNPRGLSQLLPFRRALAQAGAFDGPVYASDATRAQETLEGILPEPLRPGQVTTCPELYTFNWRKLAHWLQHLDNGDCVAIVGHNPALLELAGWLLKHPPAHLPTASLIHIRLSIKHWDQLARHTGKLETFLTPAEYSYGHFARKRKKPANDSDIPSSLLEQTALIQQLQPGVVQGLDDEFLHQYRVAIRRSRAIAESLQEVTGDKLLARSILQLKRHANATSHLRDLHVFLSDLPELCQEDSQTRQTLVAYLSRRAGKEHKKLVKRLSSKRYLDSIAVWEGFIESRNFRKLASKLSSASICKAVTRRGREFNRRTAELTHLSPDEDIHSLRKRLKRLRYLMELAPSHWKKPLKGIKARQDRYGRFQDLCVQIKLVEEFMAGEAGASDANLLPVHSALSAKKALSRTEILALGSLDCTPDTKME